jgi:hypothetical protein
VTITTATWPWNIARTAASPCRRTRTLPAASISAMPESLLSNFASQVTSRVRPSE